MRSAFLLHPSLLVGILLALACLAPRESLALTASKSLPFYARDMEYYYQERRPEVLPGILRTFDAQGVLADGQKRLMLAAFLAETLRRDPTVRRRILPPPPTLGRDGRRVLAWVAHLAHLPDEEALLAELLDSRDSALLEQIRQSPRQLGRWDIYAEKTVLQMYWAAWMASGDSVWLDAIIKAALRYARLNAAGRQNDPAFPVCAAAAASLYELAPRHAAVRARVEQFCAGLTGPENDTLCIILREK